MHPIVCETLSQLWCSITKLCQNFYVHFWHFTKILLFCNVPLRSFELHVPEYIIVQSATAHGSLKVFKRQYMYTAHYAGSVSSTQSGSVLHAINVCDGNHTKSFERKSRQSCR